MIAQTAGLAPEALEGLFTPRIMLVMVNDAGAILDVRQADPTFLLAQIAAQQQANANSDTVEGDTSCNKPKPAAGRFPWLSG